MCLLVKACLRKDLRYDRPHAKAVRLRMGSLERVQGCKWNGSTLRRWGSGFVIVPKRLQKNNGFFFCVKCRTKVYGAGFFAFISQKAVHGTGIGRQTARDFHPLWWLSRYEQSALGFIGVDPIQQ